MIDELRNDIRTRLESAKHPSLLCSFGKDSLLLLHITHEIKPDIPIIYFGDKLTAQAEQTIKALDLTVFSYAPADRYLVPNGNGLALIDEYSFGQARVPLVNEIVEGKCSHMIPTMRTPLFNYKFDLTLAGYKRGESCPAVGTSFPQEIDLGVTRIYSPLFNWTDCEVFNALDDMGIAYSRDSDRWEMCRDCLNEIENYEWNRALSLSAFRTRFQFH